MEDNEQLLIAQTIIQQMGGRNRLTAMIGMWNICQETNGVSFRFKGSRIANYVKIILLCDTYTMDFMLIDPRNNLCKTTDTFTDVYDDMLKSIFESHTKLRLSL